MEGLGGLILLGLILGIFVAFVLIMRLFGAWMLRINDVIKELRQIKMLLQIIEDRTDEGGSAGSDTS